MISKLTLFSFAVLFSLAALFATSFSLGAPPTAAYDPQLAWTALWYSKVSSCTDASSIGSWTCGPSCSHFPNFQIEGVHANTTMDDLAFTGYDPDRNMIVVSAQGSEDWKEWVTDANLKQVPASSIYPSAPSAALIHQGFLDEWLSYSASVLTGVNALMAKHPNAEMILVTGHSLGGAVALLAGLAIIQMETAIPVRVYTYGEPRVGNPAFASWAQQFGFSTIHKQIRVTHRRDPVPHLPTMSMFGKHWLHVPQEVWYDNQGNTTYKLCTGDAEQGKEDPNCSDSVLPIDPFDHTRYLGICTGCSCSSEEVTKMAIKSAKIRKDPAFQCAIKAIMDDNKKMMNQ